MLTARPHEAPPQHRLGTWVEDHDPLLWSKVLSAPDGAGCSLTPRRRARHRRRTGGLNAPDGAGRPLGAQFPVTHTRDGITQHNTAHNGLIPPLCANGVA